VVAQLVYVRANIFGVLPTGSPLDHSKTGKLAQSRQGAIDIAPFSDSRGIAGFDSEVVVHSDAQLLFAAQVPLRRLNRNVPEQELNLIQLATREMTQTGTSPAEIVRCKLLDSRASRCVFDDFPKNLWRHPVSLDLACLVD
jgi:hypothetical protein